MTFAAYMLRCADGRYYVGHTDDLERCIAQHEHGGVPGFTQSRLPIEHIWSEHFPSREEAIAAEQRIKGWSRAKKEALTRQDWPAVQALAKKNFAGGAALRYAASTSSAATQGERVSPDLSRGIAAAPPPIIVLVRPQLGENIGKAARAMLNFGLTELRLVTPRDGWPNPSAGPAASGADIVLERAQVFESVADAIADCGHVYATTVRRRDVTKPVVTPEEAARAIHAAPERSAILFGPERSGLETDDVTIARTIITVPINPQFGSLNLAQAVILCAYEWSKGEKLAQPPTREELPPAPQEELDGMIVQLDAMLERAGYYFPPDRATATRRTLRSLLTKPGWNALEVRTLRGVFSKLDRPRR